MATPESFHCYIRGHLCTVFGVHCKDERDTGMAEHFEIHGATRHDDCEVLDEEDLEEQEWTVISEQYFNTRPFDELEHTVYSYEPEYEDVPDHAWSTFTAPSSHVKLWDMGTHSLLMLYDTEDGFALTCAVSEISRGSYPYQRMWEGETPEQYDARFLEELDPDPMGDWHGRNE